MSGAAADHPAAYAHPGAGRAPWGSGPGPDQPPLPARLWEAWWAMPKPFRIAAMVLGFIAWWPIGLALLILMACTGRLGRGWRNGHHGPHRHHHHHPGTGPSWGGWGCGRRDAEAAAATSSGNRAFDEYRQETLRRLEEEQRDFAAFLDRLRFAKDKAEFDQFMAERRRPPQTPPAEPTPQGQG
jgi:hypothetical protein